jgi:hypothetical protein
MYQPVLGWHSIQLLTRRKVRAIMYLVLVGLVGLGDLLQAEQSEASEDDRPTVARVIEEQTIEDTEDAQGAGDVEPPPGLRDLGHTYSLRTEGAALCTSR